MITYESSEAKFGRALKQYKLNMDIISIDDPDIPSDEGTVELNERKIKIIEELLESVCEYLKEQIQNKGRKE